MDKETMNEKFDRAKAIVSKLTDAGYEAMIVGGAVRDFVMGLEPTDFDIATNALPESIESLFERTIPVGRQFGVILVCMESDQFEVATFREDLPYQDGRHPSGVVFSDARADVLRRDFTINGLFWHPFSGDIVDYVEGKQDVQRKLVRAIGKPSDRFAEDHLRVLRAVRFAANLDFAIEESTWQAVCAMAPHLAGVSVERLRVEFEKILLRGNTCKGLDLMQQSGLMRFVVPVDWMPSKNQDLPEFPRALWQEWHAGNSLESALAMLFLGTEQLLHYQSESYSYQSHAGWPARLKQLHPFLKQMSFPNKIIHGTLGILSDILHTVDAKLLDSAFARRLLGGALGPFTLSVLKRLESIREVKFSLCQELEIIRASLGERSLLPPPWVNGHDLLKLGMPQDRTFSNWLERTYNYQLNHDDVLGPADVRQWLETTWRQESKQ